MKNGFRNWKKALGNTGKFKTHENSRMHLLAQERSLNFEKAKPISLLLNEASVADISKKERERIENRSIVQVLFDVVLHLAKQNSSFRGHDETEDSKNAGNFLEEIKFLAKYHPPLQLWLDKHPGNVSYISSVTQNEMISIWSDIITNRITNEVLDAKYYSIECDEVTSHRKAFLSIIIRYVLSDKIVERLVKAVQVSSLTGKSLSQVIIQALTGLNLNLGNMVGMGFDGASNMSGCDEGVQAHLRRAGANLAQYFHCFAHRLNLVLEQSVKSVLPVDEVFSIIGELYKFMEGSPKRHSIYERHLIEQGITKGKTALFGYSDTRWTAKSDNLSVIINVYQIIQR